MAFYLCSRLTIVLPENLLEVGHVDVVDLELPILQRNTQIAIGEKWVRIQISYVLHLIDKSLNAKRFQLAIGRFICRQTSSSSSRVANIRSILRPKLETSSLNWDIYECDMIGFQQITKKAKNQIAATYRKLLKRKRQNGFIHNYINLFHKICQLESCSKRKCYVITTPINFEIFKT